MDKEKWENPELIEQPKYMIKSINEDNYSKQIVKELHLIANELNTLNKILRRNK